MAASLSFVESSTQCESIHIEKYRVSWSEYEKKIIILVLRIMQSGWTPDVVICLGRGGMAPGEGVARLLKKPLGVRMCKSYGGEGEMKQGYLKIAEQITILASGFKKVLLLDDLTDTGNSLLENKALLLKEYPDIEVKTAVIFQKSASQFMPDYLAEKVPAQKWIVLPNEAMDEIALNKINPASLKDLDNEALSQLATALLEL